jgi:hypothetical protein
MVARRMTQRALTDPFAVYHREGKVYVRSGGQEVMVNMTPDTARAWARALDENADAAESGSGCGCGECWAIRQD